MAYVAEVDNGNGSTDTYFLNNHAVGKNADNWWADIQVVQYLIRNVYQLNAFENNAGCWGVSEVTKNDIYDLPNPAIDYKKISKTIKWIEYFQADALLYNGYLIRNDGRVDAPPFEKRGGPTVYTIHLLNIVFQESCKSIGFNDYADYVLGDPALGSFAKASFLQNRSF